MTRSPQLIRHPVPLSNRVTRAVDFFNFPADIPLIKNCTNPILPASPARQLLIACMSSVPCFEHMRPLLSADIDWNWALSRFLGYGIGPLAYANLRLIAGEGNLVPKRILSRLRSANRKSCVDTITLFLKLETILSTLASLDIPVILLKGAALAPLVYRTIALRPMADLDLLVRRSDLSAAEDALCQLGCVCDESYRPREWYEQHHHHLVPYLASDGSASIELHHHCVPSTTPVQIPIAEFWQRARPISLGGSPALTLAPEDLLLSICTHLAFRKGFTAVIRDLNDVAQVIAAYGEEMDWDELVQRAIRYRTAKCLYYSLWWLELSGNASLPPNVLGDLESDIRASRAEMTLAKLLIRLAVCPGPVIIFNRAITKTLTALMRQ